jgi:hypothetical protein
MANKGVRKNPCQGCTKRSIGCHAQCQEHRDWKMEWDEYRRAIKKERIRRSKTSTVDGCCRRKNRD